MSTGGEVRDEGSSRPVLRSAVSTCVALLAAVLVASGGPSTAGADGITPGGYGWPLAPRPVVVHGFDPPAQRWLAGHRGVDLAGGEASVVRSAGSGVVHFAGTVAGRSLVSVLHPDGVLTTYEPVDPTVTVGQPVSRGAPIGTLAAGHAGCVSACLHWGARRGAGSSARYLDPLALLGVVRVRLKPLRAGDLR